MTIAIASAAMAICRLPPVYLLVHALGGRLVVLQIGEHRGIHAYMECITLVRSERHERGTHRPAVQVTCHIEVRITEFLCFEIVRGRS